MKNQENCKLGRPWETICSYFECAECSKGAEIMACPSRGFMVTFLISWLAASNHPTVSGPGKLLRPSPPYCLCCVSSGKVWAAVRQVVTVKSYSDRDWVLECSHWETSLDQGMCGLRHTCQWIPLWEPSQHCCFRSKAMIPVDVLHYWKWFVKYISFYRYPVTYRTVCGKLREERRKQSFCSVSPHT